MIGKFCRFPGFGLCSLVLCVVCTRITSSVLAAQIDEAAALEFSDVGFYKLQVITPKMLELMLVTSKKPAPAEVETWNFIGGDGKAHLPQLNSFTVSAGDKILNVAKVGFKRRVLYAPLKSRDLRIGNYLYLELTEAIPENGVVEVKNPDRKLWPPSTRFITRAEENRVNPAIHVNQVGYFPKNSKKAMVGYYCGSLGELSITSGTNAALPPSFELLDANTSKTVFHGELKPRRDQGFPFDCYQKVWEADFTSFQAPGEYRLHVPGMGSSFAFSIDDGVAAALARTYALGVYHQRCGTSNAFPFTRFTHDICHNKKAEVPRENGQFAAVDEVLNKETANYKDNPRHTARQLKDIAASLYPFVNTGPVNVSGGHHDAGDYSKYTINSSAFIHQLMFAVDVFAGVEDLDNLGLPESGDGKSDIMQEVKWEADFLAKMQDTDGGFYFLVYPKEREYEIDVTPDHGDPQVVFPKTTAVTAAATAALAQCASSPRFRRQFPEAAALYLEKARKGWAFLDKALNKYGKDGSYQKITHYGDYFMQDDELAWAACEMWLATGEEAIHKKLLEWLDPENPETRMWSWWRLFDAYGCAIRSYAFASRAGKVTRDKQDRLLLEKCEAEIAAAGDDQLRRSQQCAYGSSFPEETKRARTAGWFFSDDAAFDLAVALQLDYPSKADPRPQMLDALLSNLNYEQGCNPVNIDYLTGLGWVRQREIVHQYAQNDRRILPPTGIPLGNIQGGFGWMDLYKEELGTLSFPADADERNPYPIYDRWGDAFNLTQEFVIVNQSRALACAAFLMAQSSVKTQAWRAATGSIKGIPDKLRVGTKTQLQLISDGLDFSTARITWEINGEAVHMAKVLEFIPAKTGNLWLEAEGQLPDGRRVFAATNVVVRK